MTDKDNDSDTISKEKMEEIEANVDQLNENVEELKLQVTPSPKLNPLEIENRLSSVETKINILIGAIGASVPLMLLGIKLILG